MTDGTKGRMAMPIDEMARLQGRALEEFEDAKRKEQKGSDYAYALHHCLNNARMLTDIGEQFINEACWVTEDYKEEEVDETLQRLQVCFQCVCRGVEQARKQLQSIIEEQGLASD